MYLCFLSNEFLLSVKCQYDCNQILLDTKDSYTTIISNEISLRTFSFEPCKWFYRKTFDIQILKVLPQRLSLVERCWGGRVYTIAITYAIYSIVISPAIERHIILRMMFESLYCPCRNISLVTAASTVESIPLMTPAFLR